MKKIFILSQIAAIVCLSLTATAQNIVTVAGNGQISYGGDSGPALNAAYNNPTGIFIGPGGSLYISDSRNNVVRVINGGTGIITTIAGNGFRAGIGGGGYTGDGGAATGAELFGPQAVIADSSGNLYIADAGNHVVRMVNTSGTIITVAGNGTAGSTGDGGAATAATLNFPEGVANGPGGNLYIADFNANAIRKVNISTGIISTIAGGNVTGGFGGDGGAATAATLGGPSFIAVDRSGNIYFTDGGNHRIREINTSGMINTIAGTGTPGSTGDHGPATAAELNIPLGITVDSSGNVYFTDISESVIRKISSGIITTVAGISGSAGYSGDGGPATAAMLNAPDDLTIDGSGNIFMTDHNTKVIRKISSGGIIATISGSVDSFFCGDGSPAVTAELDSPMASAFDTAGNMYVADFANNCVRIIRPSGNIETFAGFALAGPGFGGDGGAATAARLNHPKGVATDASGNVYISDAGNSCIRIVHPSGNIATFAGTPLSPGFSGDGGSALSAQIADPGGLAVDTAGNVYIADAANHRVRIVHPSGNITTFAGTVTAGSSGDGSAATSAELDVPTGIAIDAAGNVYIADTGAARVRIVHPSGNIETFAGNGIHGYSGDGSAATSAELMAPMSIVVDDSGNVHIADCTNARVRIVHPSGNITTYAGTGTAGFNGDGPVGSSQLNWPTGLSKDASGKLYMTDRNNFRVRRFSNPGALQVKAAGLLNESIAVYPNPNNGSFIINFSSGMQEEVHYIVTNLLGQKIREANGRSNQPFELQLSVAPGIYLLNAITSNARKTVKVVVGY